MIDWYWWSVLFPLWIPLAWLLLWFACSWGKRNWRMRNVEEKKVCVGDLVQVLDGSWSMERVDGEWKPNTHPAGPHRKSLRWVVIAVDCTLPTPSLVGCSYLWAPNSLLLELGTEPGHLLCSQPRFVKVVTPALAPKTLEERVAELEKKVGLT